MSASIGLVERGSTAPTSADLMRAADITLYWAKADGKGRWALYDPERNAREVARFTLSATMPAALERDEFYVDYQPLVRLEDSKVLGVEALVRWQHPEFGRLAPDRFIELAEETGLIVPLGRLGAAQGVPAGPALAGHVRRHGAVRQRQPRGAAVRATRRWSTT